MKLLLFALSILFWVAGGSAGEPNARNCFELCIHTVTLERFRDTVEPVRRRHGITIIGYDYQFEGKKVDGKALITRKGSNERVSGMEVKLSTDLP